MWDRCTDFRVAPVCCAGVYSGVRKFYSRDTGRNLLVRCDMISVRSRGRLRRMVSDKDISQRFQDSVRMLKPVTAARVAIGGLRVKSIELIAYCGCRRVIHPVPNRDFEAFIRLHGEQSAYSRAHGGHFSSRPLLGRVLDLTLLLTLLLTF